MFAVDTRLRPNGREGDLVQTEAAYKTYFAKHAEAWEGIAYMKSRAVAGNVERATEFLHELAGSGLAPLRAERRSRKELAEMRARLEREQGAAQPAEGRDRRLLRYRFRPDVPAAEGRRHLLTKC